MTLANSKILFSFHANLASAIKEVVSIAPNLLGVRFMVVELFGQSSETPSMVYFYILPITTGSSDCATKVEKLTSRQAGYKI